MDRLIASNSVPLAQADTAPATGTPQYATDGNPATNTPATLWPAYAFNALQDEVYNVIVGAGLTPNRNVWNQLLAAIVALIAQPQTNKVSGVVGQVRNLFMQVTAASASGTLQADEIIVESALGGLRYCVANFNKTINLATTGAGGMDTGTAPASGFVAIYAIFNPTTGVSTLLATNATAAAAQNVYGGANMPAGYTASALVSVWATTPAGLLAVGVQRDRRISTPTIGLLSTTSPVTALTSLSIASAAPKNAVEVDIYLGLTQFVAGNGIVLNAYGSAQSTDLLTAEAGAVGATLNSVNIKGRIMPASGQTLFYNMSNTNTGSFAIALTGYSI